MIRLLGRVDRSFVIALSGGIDSMVALDFLTRCNYQRFRKRNVLALYFDHRTEHGTKAREYVQNFCIRNKIPIVIGCIDRDRERGESKEAHWREQRYSFFDSWYDRKHYRPVGFDSDSFRRSKIVTCHHLDDVVETYLFSSIRGNSKLIPHSRGRYLRPFLLTKKKQIVEYAERHGVQWLDDPSNLNQDFTRNFIRHTLIPNALKVNPGLYKTVKRKVIEQYNDQQEF
tara:strand:+ start:9252 stop:9935 length:684 start_codon:yes stop_codon:yes gene_type:complete